MGNTASVVPDEAERKRKEDILQTQDRANNGRRKSAASPNAGEGGGGVPNANGKMPTAAMTASPAQQERIDGIMEKILSQSPTSSSSVVMDSSKISSSDKMPHEAGRLSTRRGSSLHKRDDQNLPAGSTKHCSSLHKRDDHMSPSGGTKRRSSPHKRDDQKSPSGGTKRRSSLHKRDDQRPPSGGTIAAPDVDGGQHQISGTQTNKNFETAADKEAEAARNHKRNGDDGRVSGGGGGSGSGGSGDGRRGSDRDTHCGSASSDSNSSDGSYTTSSCSGSEEDSDDDDDNGSDGTFFVPEEEQNDSSRDGQVISVAEGGHDIVIKVTDGSNDLEECPSKQPSAGDGGTCADAGTATGSFGEDTNSADARKEAAAAGDENGRAGKKTGRAKRKRPAHRHYISDDTMRTLFGLIPFYGGGDGPMDQMVKATLASVRPNTIDVRDQEGNTLLILACQHACEDLVDPILAKGANPLAVNGVGICPLHYTCFSDSLSLDAAETLLWRGADPCVAETTYGCTPLHYAASSGDVDLCTMLVEHGAKPQAQDYYTYTAAKYARDAGHDVIVELLGGDEEEEAWPEAAYLERGDSDDGVAEPSGGLWLRHMDPETGLAYHMNDETGESWWELDLLAVAKDFLDAIPSDGGAAEDRTMPALPPLGAREWLVQEQVRSWLIAILSRADPVRLMEVDLILERGKADFKGMLKELLTGYGIKELDFIRKALSPKLQCLGVLALIPSLDERAPPGGGKVSPTLAEEGDALEKESPPPSTEDGPPSQQQKGDEGQSDMTSAGTMSTANAGGTAVGGEGGAAGGGQNVRDVNRGITNSGLSSAHSLKKIESRTALRVDADKKLQEATSQQERELEEERRRQKEVLDEQRRLIDSLEDKMKKQQSAMMAAKEEADKSSEKVAELQSALHDDSGGRETSDRLLDEITRLKASVAAERMQFTHITEALEATKGSLEERAAKQEALEEERQTRLAKLKTENAQKIEIIRTGASESLTKAEEEWDAQRQELERGLVEQVEQTRNLLKETVEGAAKVLSEAAEVKTVATEASQKCTSQTDEARAWMRSNQEELSHAKQIHQTNRQLNTSLRRELERAKQLHNQIEDMKGQTRVYARVRPMNEGEKNAGCKEVCLRDGKQTLAFLTSAKQHWSYTQVFQHPSMDLSAAAVAQAELYKELSGLGTSLADGHSVLLLVAGGTASGKTLTLVGHPDESSTTGGFFLPATVGSGAAAVTAGTPAGVDSTVKKGPRKTKGNKGGGDADADTGGGGGIAARTAPMAGLFPRLMAETFATLLHRSSQCAFTAMVSAAAVSALASTASAEDTDLVECLLPSTPAQECGARSGVSAEVGTTSARPPLSPPESRLWGRAVPAESPQEVVAVIEAARSRVAAPAQDTPGPGDSEKHFLSKVRMELLNHSTNESSSSEMVIVELAEEKAGDAWPAALAQVVRAHATATTVKPDEGGGGSGSTGNPLLGMVRGCLADTAKVVTLLCMSPADSQADKTERALHFGKACQDSGEGSASQLKDLKKELARLKKESKGAKKPAPNQLPRPAGGRPAGGRPAGGRRK